MWNPTHVHILVRSAKDLKIKGKDGTNNAFVTIDLGHNKFETSVKPGSKDMVEWYELCEMKIPKHANRQTLILTAYHKNLISSDQFLGTISISLKRFLDYHNQAQKLTKCYRLSCKPGQTKTDYRGELEIGISFIVKSTNECSQSFSDQSSSLPKVSRESKQHKMSTLSLNQQDDVSTLTYCNSGDCGSTSPINNETKYLMSPPIMRKVGKCNLGLSSEDAEKFLSNLILEDHVENTIINNSTHKSLNLSRHLFLPQSVINVIKSRKQMKETRERFHNLPKDNLIDIIVGFHSKILDHRRRELELEEYIDSLTAKVLETAPEILMHNEEYKEND